MEKLIRGIIAILLGIIFTGSCLAEEGTDDAAELVREAKIYIEQGDKEKAILNLDAAFESANSTGDYELLMEIGDLYVAVDSSLDDEAMEAWTAAGRWKCR